MSPQVRVIFAAVTLSAVAATAVLVGQAATSGRLEEVMRQSNDIQYGGDKGCVLSCPK